MSGRIGRRFSREMLRLMLAFSLLSAAACAQEPETASLTAVAFSYGEAHAKVLVNGEWAGGGNNSVEYGDVLGGGHICCIDIPKGAKTAIVEVQTGVDKWYVVEAEIEQPWPEYMHYAAVHVLPGRHVVISIMGSSPAPRKDLLVEQLDEMGISDFKVLDPHMWDSGPEEQL
ncbi:MAG: hypothetical protein ACREPV_04505 [Lysobacter sp.]